MYRCPDGPGDGMEVDYRSSDLDIAECLSAIRRENQIFDIALIDEGFMLGSPHEQSR